MLARIIAHLKGLTCWMGCKSVDLFPLRHDWPDCCRDADEMRRILQGMREECWRSGL
ncbi:MAG: hypothetical protein ACRCUC_14110 [Aestuariivirga sp.]|jgi:hypothetical protein